MSEFKAGDSVYRIFGSGKLDVVMNSESHNYPIIVGGYTYLEDGRHSDSALFRTLFHATKENHTALSTLFPEIQFELPPLTSNEIVQHMLKEGKPVMCYLSDDSYDMAVFKGIYGLVASYDADEGFDAGGDCWQYVVPMKKPDVLSKIAFAEGV